MIWRAFWRRRPLVMLEELVLVVMSEAPWPAGISLPPLCVVGPKIGFLCAQTWLTACQSGTLIGSMHAYRLYVFDEKDQLVGPALPISARDDRDAIEHALGLLNGSRAVLRDDLRLVKEFRDGELRSQ
jgi:hypothetical protein